jgi:hypothetical protein
VVSYTLSYLSPLTRSHMDMMPPMDGMCDLVNHKAELVRLRRRIQNQIKNERRKRRRLIAKADQLTEQELRDLLAARSAQGN